MMRDIHFHSRIDIPDDILINNNRFNRFLPEKEGLFSLQKLFTNFEKCHIQNLRKSKF